MKPSRRIPALRAALLGGALLAFAPEVASGQQLGEGMKRTGTVGIQNDDERRLFHSLICTCGCPRETLGTCTCDFAHARREELRALLRFFTTAASPWAPAGFELGFAEFPLRVAAPARQRRSRRARPQRDDGAWLLGRDGFAMAAAADGTVTVRRDGRTLVHDMALSLWRAPVDNDGIKLLSPPGGVLRRWLDWGLDRLVRDRPEVTVSGDTIRSHDRLSLCCRARA